MRRGPHNRRCAFPLLAAFALPILLARAAHAGERIAPELDATARALADPDWERRETATHDLAAFGDAALPVAFRLLDHPDPEVRIRADRVIRNLRDSPRLLREAFRAGPAGAAWAFRVIPSSHGPVSPPQRSALATLVECAGWYGGPECAGPLAELILAETPGAPEALAILGAPREAVRALRAIYRPASARLLLPAMGAVGNPEAVAFLRERRTSGDPEERAWALSGLRAAARTGALSVLARALLDDSALARSEALKRLRRADSSARTRAADFVLRSGRPPGTILEALDRTWCRSHVAPELLGFRRAAALVDPLLDALSGDPPPGRATWILSVLAGYPEERRALEAIVAAGADPVLAPAAREALARTGSRAAAPVAQALASGVLPASEEWFALVVSSGGRPAREALELLLLSGRTRLSRRAAEALGRGGGAEAVQILFRGLEGGADPAGTVAALGLLGPEVGFARLAALLSRGAPPPELLEGLGATGDPRAGPLLLDACGHAALRGAALSGLGRLGDVSTLPVVLRGLLDDRHWPAALEAAVRFDPPPVEALERVAAACRWLGYIERAEIVSDALSRLRGLR